LTTGNTTSKRRNKLTRGKIIVRSCRGGMEPPEEEKETKRLVVESTLQQTGPTNEGGASHNLF